jgi:hypothetical protein
MSNRLPEISKVTFWEEFSFQFYDSYDSSFKQNGLPMISSINTNFCGIFGGLEDQVCNLQKGKMFLSRNCVPLRACRACGAAAPRASAGPAAASNLAATPPPPLPLSDPPEAPSLPCLLLHPSHGGGNFSTKSTKYIVLWISSAITQCTYGAAVKLFCRFPSCE